MYKNYHHTITMNCDYLSPKMYNYYISNPNFTPSQNIKLDIKVEMLKKNVWQESYRHVNYIMQRNISHKSYQTTCYLNDHQSLGFI